MKREHDRGKKDYFQYPWKLIIGYFIFGFLWIAFSDGILVMLVKDPEVYQTMQTYKGWSFILITTVLLFALVYVENKRFRKISQEKALISEDLTIQKRYSDIFFNDNKASIVVWDLTGVIIEANDAFLELVGYGQELIGQNWMNTTLPPEEKINIDLVIKDLRDRKQVRNFENTVMTKRGDRLTMLWNDVLIDNPNGHGEVVVAFGLDVTKEREHERRLLEMVYRDGLTGIKNRMAFEHKLNDLVDQETAITVVLLGIKAFKRLNEVHGHQYGDRFLTKYSKVITEEIQDLELFRWGGDEFIGLITSEDQGLIRSVLDQLKSITEQDWIFGELTYQPEINVGLASYPTDASNGMTLMKYVDLAFQGSKQNPNSDETFYADELLHLLEHRTLVEKALDGALENDELLMYYQPIYKVETGEMYGFEMLLRWFTPAVKHIGEVIAIAEQSGQIRKIDRWVLEKAFKVISSDFRDKAYIFAVNLSAQTISSGKLTGYLQVLLDKYDINPAMIEIEITEYSVMNDLEEGIRIIKEIKALGFKVSLDDFGTKYSSLNYLSKIDFDILKIDKSYIDFILTNEKDRIVVSEIIHLSSMLGMETVAEGIETKEQEELLKEMGCLYGQGYYFAKPMAHKEMIRLIGAQDN